MSAVNKERVRLWIDALESGDHEQSRGCLIRHAGDPSEELCCLGVACRVAEKEGIVELIGNNQFGPHDIEPGMFNFNFETSATRLPLAVAEWFGFDETNPRLINEHGDPDSCVHANDALGYSFEEIAKGLRKQYLEEAT